MNGTTTAPAVVALPLLPKVLRIADWVLPPLPAEHPLATTRMLPKEINYPVFHLARESLWPGLSDKYLALAAPVVAYWVLSLVYEVIDRMQWPLFEQYRIHEPDEIKARNKVTKTEVVKMVAVQQIIQTALGLVVLDPDEVIHAQVATDHRGGIIRTGNYLIRFVARLFGAEQASWLLERWGVQTASWLYWWGIPLAQYIWAAFVMDTWQFGLHWLVHANRFLYKHFHSHHHRLYVPYAFGALYNHPLEGLLLDSFGAALSYAMSIMTVRQSVLLFAFSTLKTVDDHGGYAFPWWIDPLHLIFPNTAEYHDIHHQMQGLRFNYSQPFFIHWDVIFGTRMDNERLSKLRAHAAKKTWKGKEENDQQDLESYSAPVDQAATSIATGSEGVRIRQRASHTAPPAVAIP